MIVDAFHGVFVVLKFFFGLGALFALLGIAGVFLWFVLRAIALQVLRTQPAERYLLVRKLFLAA
jgi:hypothetical protein